ncbi:hypothetical protein HMPREF3213_00025, partial [Heyndrickxia coagulans]
QKDKRSRGPEQIVLLEHPKGQKEPLTGTKCLFGVFKRTKMVLCQESRHIDLRYFYLKPLPHFVWLGIRNDQSKGVIDHL